MSYISTVYRRSVKDFRGVVCANFLFFRGVFGGGGGGKELPSALLHKTFRIFLYVIFVGEMSALIKLG